MVGVCGAQGRRLPEMAKKTTLRDLARRISELEQEMVNLRQQLGSSLMLDGVASEAPDLNAALDQFFEAVGVQGELSGFARLRAIQAKQERLWTHGIRNGE